MKTTISGRRRIRITFKNKIINLSLTNAMIIFNKLTREELINHLESVKVKVIFEEYYG